MHARVWSVVAAGFSLAGFWAVLFAAEPAKPPADKLPPNKPSAGGPQTFATVVQPFVKRYCLDCHRGKDAESGMRLDKYGPLTAVSDDRKTWRKVLNLLKSRKMPPENNPRPQMAEYEAVTAWLDKALGPDESETAGPGRVTIRRLNQAEYGNTIRDLLGVEFNATAADFPSDDIGYGFDNIGDVLTLPPLLMEKYLDAAEQIAQKAIVTDKPGKFGKKFNDYPASHRRIFLVMPGKALSADQAAEKILRRLAMRAYRRPVSDKELHRLTALAASSRAKGESFESSIQLALQAVLVSPYFLFRVEIDRNRKSNEPVRSLNEYELASRLSYFLWSSMPDDELFDLAGGGKLRENLESQVRRMLIDPKAKALAENFATQWLQLRKLDRLAPDASQFPEYDQELRQAMRTESQMFFTAVVREDRSAMDFIDADYTFVNERLARFYGLKGIEGDRFRRVSLPADGEDGSSARGGVITQAAVLFSTSNPSRTSPVKRGKWILENILGTPPPDPPPGIPKLPDDSKKVVSGTLRQRMEQHRADPNCAVCHRDMDALGFALENFNVIGAWRTKDGDFPIDAAAKLPDGRSFNGPRELKAVLRENKQQFARCLAEKLLTFALGRGIESYDRLTIDEIVRMAGADDYKFSKFILGIVKSDPFQKAMRLKGQ